MDRSEGPDLHSAVGGDLFRSADLCRGGGAGGVHVVQAGAWGCCGGFRVGGWVGGWVGGEGWRGWQS